MQVGGGSRLFITNISRRVDWWQLKEHLKKHYVTACLVDIVCDSKSGLPTGEALVDLGDNAFERLQEAGRRLTVTILCGRPVFACPDPRGLQDERQAGTLWCSRFGERGPGCGYPADGGRPQYSRRPRRLLSRSRSRGSKPAAAPRVVPPPLHLRKPQPSPLPDPDDQASRRLFVEGLSSTVTPQVLMRHVTDHNFEVAYVDIVRTEDASFGIIEFKTRLDALEACIMLSGSVIDKDDVQPIRLRQDRSEFDDMKAAGFRNAASVQRADRRQASGVCAAASSPGRTGGCAR